jgi:hypothetical protein
MDWMKILEVFISSFFALVFGIILFRLTERYSFSSANHSASPGLLRYVALCCDVLQYIHNQPVYKITLKRDGLLVYVALCFDAWQ